MQASVIITSRNEKKDLVATIADCAYGLSKPQQIIVVDDQSDPAVLSTNVDKFYPLAELYRTPEQLGVAASRNFGASKILHSTDLLIFMDSHMRLPDWWLEAIFAEAIRLEELGSPAILCPSCCAFNHGYGSNFHGCGADFDPDKVGFEPIWRPYTGSEEQSEIVPCILGACYIVPRVIWEDLGGFNPIFHGWGQDEQDISIRAWQAGYEVRAMSNLTVAHRWDRNAIMDDDPNRDVKETWQGAYTEEERKHLCIEGDMMNTWQPGFNAIVSCFVLPEDDLFFGNYEHKLKERWPDAMAWHRFHEKFDEIVAYRQQVQAKRKRSDKRIEMYIGKFLPSCDAATSDQDRVTGYTPLAPVVTGQGSFTNK